MKYVKKSNTSVNSIEKQWLVKQMDIPRDMAYEISSFLFYTPFQQNKRNLNVFIDQNIIRYEENAITKCVWGVGFLYYNAPQLQHINCLRCGNFIVQYEEEFKTKNQCCLCN